MPAVAPAPQPQAVQQPQAPTQQPQVAAQQPPPLPTNGPTAPQPPTLGDGKLTNGTTTSTAIKVVKSLEDLGGVIQYLAKHGPSGASGLEVTFDPSGDRAELVKARDFVLNMPKDLKDSVALFANLLTQERNDPAHVTAVLAKYGLADVSTLPSLEVTKTQTIDLRTAQVTNPAQLSKTIAEMIAKSESSQGNKPLVFVRLPTPQSAGESVAKEIGTWCKSMTDLRDPVAANFKHLRATHNGPNPKSAMYEPPFMTADDLMALVAAQSAPPAAVQVSANPATGTQAPIPLASTANPSPTAQPAAQANGQAPIQQQLSPPTSPPTSPPPPAAPVGGTQPVLDLPLLPILLGATPKAKPAGANPPVGTNGQPGATTAPITRPIARPSAQPAAQAVAQPVVRPAAQPVAQPAVQPVAQPAAQPAVQPAAQPAVRLAAQPVAQPVVQPAAQPVAQPAVQPVAQPVAQPAAQPATHPASVEVARKDFADSLTAEIAANPSLGAVMNKRYLAGIQTKDTDGWVFSVAGVYHLLADPRVTTTPAVGDLRDKAVEFMTECVKVGAGAQLQRMLLRGEALHNDYAVVLVQPKPASTAGEVLVLDLANAADGALELSPNHIGGAEKAAIGSSPVIDNSFPRLRQDVPSVMVMDKTTGDMCYIEDYIAKVA